MENGGQAIAVGTDQMFPVFRGLVIAKIPGNKLAGLIGVAPATFSKWRTGRSKIPAETLVFLTLLLANRLEDLHGECPSGGTGEGAKGLRYRAALKSIRRHLSDQEVINGTLHPSAVRQGARLFRRWWQETSNEASGDCGGDIRPDQFSALSYAMSDPNYQRQDAAL